ncbi:MAG: putative hydrolase, alpha/beta hydrolase family [Marmoricola sp.]|nr:putative hydrolase, alpha/beta hydrolase family [Marmoricola sp.]
MSATPALAPAPAPVVLVAPAMAIGSAYYRPVVEELTARGCVARALPRRGFEPGGPGAGRAHDWSYADEIGDIADAVAQAREEHPDRPVLLLGHSLGGQLAAGHELTRTPVDGLVTVGGCLPHFRDYPYAGLHIAAMGALVVPTLTTVFGYLPRPAFGGPGARTLMREWARMAVTGHPPYAVEQRVRTPSLLISLEGDDLAPARAVDAFARRLFEREAVTRWHYRDADVPPEASNDHVAWVRSPATVVDRVLRWWAER